MTQEVKVALTQLVLWYDGTRIQTWPSMLAKADPKETYRSTRAFGARFYTDRKTKSGHSAADNTTKNMPGLEEKNGSLLLRGVGFLEKVKGGYQLSESGLQLVAAYRDDPKGRSWVSILGTELLTREPRTRVFIKMMSANDASLYFTDDEWWGGSIQRATIATPDGQEFQPFTESESSSHLRDQINSDPEWALGDWRENKYICDLDKIIFSGQAGSKYSLCGISTALKASCEVFLHLGVIESHSDRAWLNQQQAVNIFGIKVASEFGWATGAANPSDLFGRITNLVQQLTAETGYLVASELRTKLEELGVENPDAEIAELESQGRLVVEETDFGHGRHGKGLYGDQSKQLIKIRLN